MRKLHRVRLTAAERAVLRDEIAAGAAPARRLAHARILLKADEGPGGPAWPDARIAEALDVSVATVERVRRRYVAEGLGAALARRRPHPVPRRKLDGAQEAHLIALACSAPPAGRERWTVRLLAERFVGLSAGESVSRETVRRTLKKTRSSRG
jgi:transposase